MRNTRLQLKESLGVPGAGGLEDSLPELREGRLIRNGRLARAALKVAMSQELTPRQRECIELYFSQRLTMEQIGRRLGIGKSTVHKHIETGKAHIRRVLAYAEAFQAVMDREDEESKPLVN